MQILTYKRTHTGDPGPEGVFGVNDCMGSVRNWKYDAVVGIGSKSPWDNSRQIAGKITWVGVGPYKTGKSGPRGNDQIAFEHFILLDGNGPDFESIAPNLARRFYQGNARSILRSYSDTEKKEIEKLIIELLQWKECQHNPDKSAKPVNDKLQKRRDKCSKRLAHKRPPC